MGKLFIFTLVFLSTFSMLFANDLKDIKQRGELRHLGVPYANFVTGLGDGLDVELIKGFAKHLGVKYRFIKSDWLSIVGDLSGTNTINSDNGAVLLNKVPIKGDIAASGITILDWRKEVINFSSPTFPSSVWLLSPANSSMKPIKPTNNISKDINLVKKTLFKKSVLSIDNTCLDHRLYKLKSTSEAKVISFKKSNNPIDLIPALLNNEADSTLIDLPDALIALNKWSGEIKIIGPVSQEQRMGVAFRKNSPELYKEFHKYFEKIKADGTYKQLVKRYYPDVFLYQGDFFNI